MTRLLEVKDAFRQLSYFDLRHRSRLTLELARITISLPLALEQAVQRERERQQDEQTGDPVSTDVVLNRRLRTLLRGSAVVLERLEQLLK